MNTTPLSWFFSLYLLSDSLCLQSIADKNPNDEPQLSGVNWLPCCTNVYVKVHVCQCTEVCVRVCTLLSTVMSLHVCLGVYLCAHVPHWECVLCDPGNAKQRLKGRANERRPRFIHLLSFTGLVQHVSVYWSVAWLCVVFAGRWQGFTGDTGVPQRAQAQTHINKRQAIYDCDAYTYILYLDTEICSENLT